MKHTLENIITHITKLISKFMIWIWDIFLHICKDIMIIAVLLIMITVVFPIVLILQMGELVIAIFKKENNKKPPILARFFDYITHHNDQWY